MGGVRSGWQQSTRKPIHLYGDAPARGSRADIHTSQRNTRCTHTARLRPAPQQPKTRVFNRLPAARRHTRGSTANSPLTASDGARAGRAPPPTGSRGFRPLNHHPPPLLHSSPRPRVPTSSAEPTDALRSPSTAAQPCISAREAPRKSGIRRKSPPPTP